MLQVVGINKEINTSRPHNRDTRCSVKTTSTYRGTDREKIIDHAKFVPL